MSIYQQVASNKLKSYLLILLFMAFFSFVFYVVGRSLGSSTEYLILGLGFSLVSGFASYFYSDKMVLWTTGARPATKKEFFDFYTVAENVSIAAGLPMPKLYVMDDASMNAFATGRDPKHAVVAATTGILQRLDRTELEGVIAHEMGHVKNYDILFSSIVSVLVGTLVLLSDWIMRSMFWFGLRRDDREERSNPLQLLFLLITLVIAPIAATLIQLAVSRRRELLADATGALVTRNPGALADALEKIGSDKQPMRHASGANAHLFISNPFKNQTARSKLAALFSTHPPIEERVKILREM
ncbi:M48 family metalloprotease [Candidatus Microgenomates bacterium]|nr:M48 family metalloprotease [Candidatus Microgenomates bacterium]